MKTPQFYECESCSQIYLRSDEEPKICEKCGKETLKIIEGRFILRCRKCGLTQNKRAFIQINGKDSLKCQASTCDGIVKVVTIGNRRSLPGSGKMGKAPRPIVGHRARLAAAATVPPDKKESVKIHPSIPSRRRLLSEPIQSQKKGLSDSILSKESGEEDKNNKENNRKLEDLEVKKHAGIRPGDILELNGEKYRIIKKLGIGGMGAVHEAENLSNGQHVAVKEFFYTRFHDPETGENHCEKYWKRESDITAIQMKSPEKHMNYLGSLKLTQFSIPEYYIFLEYIKGTPLDKWYPAKYAELSSLTIHELRWLVEKILMPIARHMYYVHQQGIVHRDLTVQNIMIVENPDDPMDVYPIIIDWGVAKYIGVDKLYNPRKPYYIASAPEATGIRNRGTPPEIMSGFEPIAASDIYMMGHMMFYLFSGGNYCPTAATHEDFVLHPADFNPDLPDDFNKVVEYMTQYEPADRMPNMIKVYEALQWLYDSTESLEKPEQGKKQYYLWCEYNDAYIPLKEGEVVTIDRNSIIAAGQNHDYDGHLYNALVPAEGGKFQLQIYIDSGYAYLRDLYSKMGTYLNNIVAANQQVYNDVPIKGVKNAFIILSDVNLQDATIEVPFIAPDGLTYRIVFKIVGKE